MFGGTVFIFDGFRHEAVFLFLFFWRCGMLGGEELFLEEKLLRLNSLKELRSLW
jgi:hypothetical protein